MRPSVLVVTTVHHPQDARIWHRQIRTLLEAGWHVTYAAPFTARGLPCPLPISDLAGVLECVDLPRSVGKRRLTAVRAARALIRKLHTTHDLVLIHDLELLLAAGGAPNVVWDVHEDTAAAIVAKPWIPVPVRRIVGWGVHRVERWAERGHRLLLAEYRYQDRFRHPHPVVPNAVEVPPVVPPPTEPRVVYLGTLTIERGVVELVEVGRALRERTGAAIRLEIIGPAHGDALAIVTDAAGAGDIHWHGFLPSDLALEHLFGALAGLSLLHDLPNYQHSMPTKLLEYMGHGVPTITTPLPLAAGLVEEAGGIIVPFGDTERIIEEILHLHSHPEESAALAARAHEVAYQKYDWSTLRDDFERTLRQWASP